ncbi:MULTISPECIES: dephospho-CoA kinase [unclassified Sphingomonas]|uniref:dephospho-CoA kinase n=1 Tax=unclassified Sphingomonas TaxID=196159 RepID=UPI0006F2689F|nr:MULTISPECIES: dephospho-CoA kinase [unclassified Sphingomonas]KQM62035.1 dephospho-CoA kinase [Sphingomonas sp. Leaf16]KQN13436.1 dephospho-CoA kinase [Sphingomonas sp. Leaf29]KQN23329.1 dephospho-CoA kinase [Sphingomonas sp. Leaf32]
MTHILGLTGSIGMGKSTVAQMFRDLGVPVFDADATVHTLQGPNGILLPAIEAAFPGTTGPAGVDRPALRARIFADPDARRWLEAIVHPAVATERQRFLDTYATAPLVVLDVPLLFETGGDSRCDSVAVVTAAAEVQRARVLARPGMTESAFAAILATQLPDAEKRARAQHLIHTDTTLAATRARVAALVACMVPHEGG